MQCGGCVSDGSVKIGPTPMAASTWHKRTVAKNMSVPRGGEGTRYDHKRHRSEVNGRTGNLPVARNNPCVSSGSNRSKEKCESENGLARRCSYDEQGGEHEIAVRFHLEVWGRSGPFWDRNPVGESGASRR